MGEVPLVLQTAACLFFLGEAQTADGWRMTITLFGTFCPSAEIPLLCCCFGLVGGTFLFLLPLSQFKSRQDSEADDWMSYS